MKRELTYATVCSGIECMSVACIGLPMRPVFFSEIEPFPCAVLKAHYPDVPNLGDMSKIQVSNDGKEITNGATRIILDRRIDILAGGTPCQDISQAGKQRGMAKDSNTRSSLAFDFVRLASELRPKYVVWENVAATISSKIAGDFLRFMSALDDCGYSLAWRVLDAQYVRVDGMERAVPQRRRRVWVVGCLGADESVPAQILFEPDCAQGHTAPRRRAGEGFDYSLAGRDRVDAGVVGGAPRVGGEPESGRGGEAAIGRGAGRGEAGNACRRCGGDGGGDKGTCISLSAKQQSLAADEQLAASLGSNDYKEPQCIALDGDKLKPREDKRKGGNGFGINEDGAGYTLTGVDRHGVAYKASNGKGEEVSATLSADDITQSGQGYVNNSVVQCYDMTHADDPGRKVEGGISPTLQSRMGTGGNQVPLAVSTQGLDGYNMSLTGEVAMTCRAKNADNEHLPLVISTNSNGEDVAPTISSCEYKMGQKQKDTSGGYVVSRRAKEGAEGE